MYNKLFVKATVRYFSTVPCVHFHFSTFFLRETSDWGERALIAFNEDWFALGIRFAQGALDDADGGIKIAIKNGGTGDERWENG